ncbi:hypothetical protein Vretimale_16602 [Volvox reticuliferus]|uniref:Uncharacterized protein n=1 Tax=Volvox reticuliferus TaxID=1737510 RepID=A0A8J4CVG2_9CHLO|nr:hypothetical protein Vretifemale_17519 [Volvox reticuliferus]GIM13503.1 hypothetical protein Vretimale_16602 [Volvox reticuliferus]
MGSETEGSSFDSNCINCWSVPRCCSTSLLYSFAQRNDTTVLDEPLYANYLKLTDVPRPYREEVLAAQNPDGNAVVSEQLLAAGGHEGRGGSRPVLYAKHMGKHKIGLGPELFRRAQHVVLVREPYGVLQSFSNVLEPTQQELGYTALLEIVSELRVLGRRPIVVNSDELVSEPAGVLRALCAALGLAWEPAMLSWPAGPKPYDGLWADWWYKNTHKSTGFDAEVRDARKPLPAHLKPLLAETYPLYDMLSRQAIRPLTETVPRPLGMHAADGAGDANDDPVTAISSSSTPSSSAAALTRPQDGCQVPAGGGAHRVGTHVYVQDPRNEDVLIGIRDGVSGRFELVWRPHARVSVLDSGYMLGDGVWEGIRLHRGVLFLLEEHFERLWEGAKAIDMDLGLSRQQLHQLVYDTVDANGMSSGVHIRLMVTRGLKPTPYQNPNITIGMPTIVIIPEHKEPSPIPREVGIRLFTVHVRRGPPDVQDPGWNSHSKLNCIAACIQANKAGADEALMLDPQGFVATCNSTNFFIVRKDMVWAPSPRHQLRGITRARVLQLCHDNCIPIKETDFYVTQVYSADEAFVTGTFAGVIPVVQVDGRVIGNGGRGPITARLQQLYADFVDRYCADGRRELR